MSEAAVLRLFKGQLDTELKTLAESRPYLNLKTHQPDPGMAFPHWYFERIEQFDINKADEIILDGFDDEKIDAVDISEDESTVRFFQFKNPQTLNKGIDDAAVDGMLNTIDLFINQRHRKKSHHSIYDEIRAAIRTSYTLVFVSSGNGLSANQQKRITAKLELWNGPNRSAFKLESQCLSDLFSKSYSRGIPTVNSKINWRLDTPPYQTKINEHKSLVCHVSAERLVEAYSNYGEKLFQQNIRNSEGSTPSNQDILRTATSADSGNFYFYNNGVSIICDDWDYDQPSWTLVMTRPQIVNGGQTVRQLHAAHVEGTLKSDVVVLLRVISIGDNKEFAGNVAVCLNNQSIVRASFLKSNHPFFIQMHHSLLSLGWYFERKPGDWENLAEGERAGLIAKIGSERNIIQMQTGCQAYCAAFMQDIELAKTHPRFIFTPKRSGGRFEDVATEQFTACRIILATELLKRVNGFIKRIKPLRRDPLEKQIKSLKKLLNCRRKLDYGQVPQFISQSGFFISALVAAQLGKDFTKLPKDSEIEMLISRAVIQMLSSASGGELTWSHRLKSQNYFDLVKEKLIGGSE